MKIARHLKGTYVNQRKYTLDIIKDVGLMGVKSARTTLSKRINFSINNSTLLTDPEKYRRLICLLLYLNLTRPDILFCSLAA